MTISTPEAICRRKIRFPKLAIARHRAITDSKTFNSKHYIYRCHVCRKWHMTTKPGAESIDVLPDWRPDSDRRGYVDGFVISPEEQHPTWLAWILLWFHETMDGLLADQPGRAQAHYAKRQRATLRARGAL